ncbi:MAG: porin, partial [Candidatus Adiutrix sp.]|nr:porin [Candidatus Adiutrix sp.]
MRKALAMGLGALLAAGSAAPLSAASQIDFSGYYRIFFANETNLGRQAGAASFTDTYFGNRLEFNIDFKPTDELTIFTRLRLPDFRRWGSGNSARNTGSGFQTRHVYGQITQDWGQLLVGRLDEDIDNFGLATLGWMPENNPVFTTVSPFDNGDPV